MDEAHATGASVVRGGLQWLQKLCAYCAHQLIKRVRYLDGDDDADDCDLSSSSSSVSRSRRVP